MSNIVIVGLAGACTASARNISSHLTPQVDSVSLPPPGLNIRLEGARSSLNAELNEYFLDNDFLES